MKCNIHGVRVGKNTCTQNLRPGTKGEVNVWETYAKLRECRYAGTLENSRYREFVWRLKLFSEVWK